MSHSDHKLFVESKAYTAAAIVTGILALSISLAGQWLLGLLTLALCATLLIAKRERKPEASADTSSPFARPALQLTTIGLAVLMLLALFFEGAQLKPWLYLIPLLIFFVYDFKPAIWLVGAYSILVIVVLNYQGSTIENVQFLASYILSIGIACSLVYLREVRRRQLKPLRRTDNLTKAATREHLDDDLTKEIQRSEREGSELSVMALAVDEICSSKLSPREQDALTIEIGKLLHNNLRLFDSYYLWEHHEFLVVLPHTSSAQALKIGNALRVKVRKEITFKNESITVSVGVAGLNVDDDCNALTQRAAMALIQSRKKGTNSTLLFREETEQHGEDEAL